MDITSRANDLFKSLLTLTTAKGLKASDRFILSGEKLIREYLRAPDPRPLQEIMAPSHTPASDASPIRLSGDLFRELDVLGTGFNLLVLAQPALPVLDAAALGDMPARGFEMVLPLGDPGNLGGMIRSCEAFGIGRVILTREAAHPFLPKCIKASAGSVLRVPLARGSALNDLPDSCIALDPGGTALADFDWPAGGRLLLGEEGPGMDASRFRRRVRVPTVGVESLNAVVAGSIVLSHLHAERDAPKTLPKRKKL